MQLQYSVVRTEEELRQIQELQKINLPKAISKEEKVKEGFVTVTHSIELLQRMNSACGHTIAKDGERLVGYALSMHPKFGNEIEVLRPMFEEIRSVLRSDQSYIVMGQICIAKEYRGMGVFRKLYETMRQNVMANFNAIITEVDITNTRSLNAHYAVGFKDLKQYKSGGQDWRLIILN